MRLFTYWCFRLEGALGEQQPFAGDSPTLRYLHRSEALQGGTLPKATQPPVHPAPPSYPRVAPLSCLRQETAYKLSYEEEVFNSSRNCLCTI